MTNKSLVTITIILLWSHSTPLFEITVDSAASQYIFYHNSLPLDEAHRYTRKNEVRTIINIILTKDLKQKYVCDSIEYYVSYFHRKLYCDSTITI